MTANAAFRSRALSRVMIACRRWQRDDRGATAIEFAMVAMPFFMFCFGILGVGLHYFSTNSLEHAVEAAARKIRTGQAQNSGMTAGEFKALVCSEASGAIDCSKLRVHVQSGDDWSISPKSCLGSDKKLAATAGGSSDKISDSSGEAAKVVLVTACYEWDLATVIPFIELGDMEGGASLIQAATTFRTEHYK
jgi:Flp pilus assembly protein TadG